MANEIEFDAVSGTTCYSTIRNSTGQVWNTVSLIFENFLAANYSQYTISATEQGTTGFFTATFPTQITEGIYNVIAKQQVGGSPAQTDTTVGTGTIGWNGTQVIDIAQLGNGVAHGGSTATLELGSTSGTAFYVHATTGTAVKFSSNTTAAAFGDEVTLTCLRLQSNNNGTSFLVENDGIGDAVGFYGKGTEVWSIINNGAGDGIQIFGANDINLTGSHSINGYLAGYATPTFVGLGAQVDTRKFLGQAVQLDANNLPKIDVADWNGTAVGNLPTNFSSLAIDANGRVTVNNNVFFKNTTFNNFAFLMVDSTGTPKTGLTPTATRSIDGGAFASCTNNVQETGSGWYRINLSSSDMNGNSIVLKFTAPGAIDTGAFIATQNT